MDNTQATQTDLQTMEAAEGVGEAVDNDAPDTQSDLISQLQAQISDLKGQIEARAQKADRISAELERLFDLFPDADTASLPDDVWEDVRRGNSLAGAYAMYARRASLKKFHTDAINERNAKQSAGRIDGSSGEYFTPDEVRAMSQSEVHANYKKILKSMPKWQNN